MPNPLPHPQEPPLVDCIALLTLTNTTARTNSMLAISKGTSTAGKFTAPAAANYSSDDPRVQGVLVTRHSLIPTMLAQAQVWAKCLKVPSIDDRHYGATASRTKFVRARTVTHSLVALVTAFHIATNRHASSTGPRSFCVAMEKTVTKAVPQTPCERRQADPHT